ncbi:MAG TPA: hypothetical protein VMW95_07785 [Desulfobacterales bacterium]|nr:hypothetical protein [Desulfobacterales bacterium]
MSVTQLYTNDEFFDTINPNAYRPGQICWVPTPNIDPIPRILDVERNTSTEHVNVKFELRQANRSDDFKKRDRSLPIKHLNLRSNEELLTQRAKKRPAIILSSQVDIFPDITRLLRQKGKKHQQQDCMFVVPCYSVQKDEYGNGFIPEIVARIQCLMYKQFFYLPQSTKFHELVARFDRIQIVIEKTPAAIEPSEVCLSDELLGLFVSLFVFCISGKTDKNLDTVKEIVREAYSEN